ncbi:MAG: hypothetical protein IT244_04035 [Bacteroidia bacterium]|nr:hypothetical protein [Bacteroidia bacterium]
MKKLGISIISCLVFFNAWSQSDSGLFVYPKSDLVQHKNFVYRLISQEYLTNENDYYLGILIDTMYLHFEKIAEPAVFKMTRSLSDDAIVPVKKKDTFLHMPLVVSFTPSGKIDSLHNWKMYRDIFVSNCSQQAKMQEITNTVFEETKTRLNNEGYVRRLVMEDINYLFALNGDTFNMDIEYIRLKTIRSPFSGFDYYFQGSMKLEKPDGSKNTILFQAKNEAGPKEKPLLMEEAKESLRSKVPKGEPISEIHSVGLNSEQSYQYNMAQQRMIRLTLADVVALDFSSRGNIRTFDLWDIGPIN